jgi:simple sugar transport system permease protein
LSADAAPPRVAGPARLFVARHRLILPIVVMFVVVLVGFGLTTDRFMSAVNVTNVLRQAAPLVVVAVGATFVLVAAGIDLSIGAMVSFTGVMTALILQAGTAPELAVPAMLLLAVAIGGLAGFLVAYQRLPSFIVTLGTLSILVGIAQLIGQGFSIPIQTEAWLIALGQGRIGGVPVPVIVALLIAALGWVLLNRTAYGLRIRGIGSNEESVRRSGAPVNLLVTSVYMLSAGLACVGGLIIAMRLQSGTATAGTGLELKAIAAVVLGGTSLFGGKGTVVGTVLGVYTLAFIENGLVLNHVDPFYFNIIQGGVLLAALWLNMGLFARMR